MPSSWRVKVMLAKLFHQYDSVCFLENVREESKRIGLPSLRHKLVSQLLKELRYLEWHGFPCKSLSPTFCAESLVQIRMPHSNVKELWHGTQDLVNLEGVNLCALHPSVLSLDTLVTLILDKCIKLKSVKSAETLHISICHLSNLWRLYLVNLRVKNLPDELSCLISLKELRICNCICLYELPNNIGKLSSLYKFTLDGSYVSNFPASIVLLKKLEILSLRNCRNLECLPELPPSIKELYLVNCICLYELPNGIGKLSSLYKLTLDGSYVSTLPTSIVLLKKLQILSLRNCRNLECLPELPPSIKELYLVNCICLYELPNGIGKLSSLYKLTLDGSYVSTLPASIVLLKLQMLSLRNCRNLEYLSQLPPCIIGLYLDNCICLYELPNDIGLLSLLHKLTLDGSYVSTLPASIVLLGNLQILSLRNCKNLECLPELPTSIKELYADNCTSLTTVSTLKAVAKLGKDYLRVSFKNCTKLDVHSLKGLAVTIATIYHVLYNKSSVMFCWPGSKVPRQCTYRATKSFIVNKLPSPSAIVGFFFTVVLSCSLGTKNNEVGEIVCEAYLAHGRGVLSKKWRYEFTDLREHDDSIVVKELGVQQLCVSGNDNFIEELDLEFDKKVELQLMLGLVFDMKPMIKVLRGTYMISRAGELKEFEYECCCCRKLMNERKNTSKMIEGVRLERNWKEGSKRRIITRSRSTPTMRTVTM
ncbi:hypothetical protein Fmac_012380 [Flemingia macrophylla]|uniref:Leucine-rich repeat domain, L domain-containing protein n=1 Tax=Flemingia macrophylla TaxID=520843 RepID=A0ABD1MQ44_9FABA